MQRFEVLYGAKYLFCAIWGISPPNCAIEDLFSEKLKETSRDSISTTQQSSPKEIWSLKQDAGIVIMEEELPQLESEFEEDRNSEHVAKEGEQLLGNRSPKISSVEHTCSPV